MEVVVVVVEVEAEAAAARPRPSGRPVRRKEESFRGIGKVDLRLAEEEALKP